MCASFKIDSFYTGSATAIPAEIVSQCYFWDSHFFSLPWEKDHWEELSQLEDYLLVYCIYGFILFKLSPLEELAHLLKIFVDPERRGQKIGEELFLHSVQQLKKQQFTKVFLEVEANNNSAFRLYNRLGFKQIHLQKDYYASGRHARVMLFEN